MWGWQCQEGLWDESLGRDLRAWGKPGSTGRVLACCLSFCFFPETPSQGSLPCPSCLGVLGWPLHSPGCLLPQTQLSNLLPITAYSENRGQPHQRPPASPAPQGRGCASWQPPCPSTGVMLLPLGPGRECSTSKCPQGLSPPRPFMWAQLPAFSTSCQRAGVVE